MAQAGPRTLAEGIPMIGGSGHMFESFTLPEFASRPSVPQGQLSCQCSQN